MLTRRKTLMVAAGGLSLACCGQNPTTTIQGIIDFVRTACGFIVSDTNAIAALVATVVPTFNPAAGAAAIVVIGVAQQVETMICNAVAQQVANPPVKGDLVGSVFSVKVHGIDIPGTYVGKAS